LTTDGGSGCPVEINLVVGGRARGEKAHQPKAASQKGGKGQRSSMERKPPFLEQKEERGVVERKRGKDSFRGGPDTAGWKLKVSKRNILLLKRKGKRPREE